MPTLANFIWSIHCELEQTVTNSVNEEDIEEFVIRNVNNNTFLGVDDDVFFANTLVGAQKLISILGNFCMLSKLYQQL